ncbi:DUF2970 domain-containing protein [Roseateles saccharophilus]|uniref:DUF2970 family protein n=1 Tax=Roseateles saccharophilus TaxID=304 RepID=A0A4R3V636_ROSSA|nr:DUF2970 domain-containing protein [Roseateles saccharophilus]MDG0833728.1 DUF2970 domain-containing protein [Roseateles saccharophilus]TCU98808.1 DUF2970 family protein [Roseateles saccharophilus]
MNEPGQDLKDAVNRKASLAQTISAVAWSFFGVRRGRDHEKDMARLNPVHVVIAGLLGAALFVLMLVLLVRWVIGSGVAGS